MTKKEAIDLLDNLIGMVEDNHNSDYDTALKMALKALEQEPTTKNDLAVDCISRAEVLKIFDEWFATCDIADKKDSPKAKIKALPSVTPQEPRKGHWIMTGDYYTGAYGNIDYVKCSCCGEDSLEEGNYCPNCGAKMESEEVEK